jgi:hypothetical protein
LLQEFANCLKIDREKTDAAPWQFANTGDFAWPTWYMSAKETADSWQNRTGILAMAQVADGAPQEP